MLIKGAIANLIVARMNRIKAVEQTDIDSAIQEEAQFVEDYIFLTIQKIQIIIPSGAITVASSTGVSTNIQPITLNNALR